METRGIIDYIFGIDYVFFRNSTTFEIGMGDAHEIENFELFMKQINNNFDDNDGK